MTKGYNFNEFIREALRLAPEPMSPTELWRFADDRGLTVKLRSSGKTPWNSVSALMYRESNENPSSDFIRIGEHPVRFWLSGRPLPKGWQSTVSSAHRADSAGKVTMSKADELSGMKRMALKEITQWLDLLGRVDDDFNGWYKDDFVDYLTPKLTVAEINALVEAYDPDGPPYIDDEVLSRVLGLPSKDTLLVNATRDDLLEVMQTLDRAGRVRIRYSSLRVGELRDYLRGKLTVQELAVLLGWTSDADDDDEEQGEEEEDDMGEETDLDEDDAEQAPPSKSTQEVNEIHSLLRRIGHRSRG